MVIQRDLHAEKPDLNSLPGMTRWFSPPLLFQAAFRDTVARLFGQFSDQRTIQHLADPIPPDSDPEARKRFAHRYDYSTKVQGDEAYWVDFAADTGDGFDSTYAIAYLMAADKLYGEQSRPVDGIQGVRGLNNTAELPHGRLLIMGGDQVYPWPDHQAYEQHMFLPYRLALPTPPPDPNAMTLPEAGRHIFAVPGNHDWYDGLSAFDDLFCRARAGRSVHDGGVRIGDWQTRQHRSSFAIKLPHNWWIWGADIQLNDLLDSGQLDYFRTIADQMGENDKFILCTAEPSWYHLGTEGEKFARINLGNLIEAPIRRGAKLCGILSGDWHHYSRYNESANLGNLNLITAGGAGAYVHGTYHLRNELDFPWLDRELKFNLACKLEPSRTPKQPEPRQTTRDACYPSKGQSFRLALGNWWRFPFNNLSFALAVGLIYWLMTWTFATLTVDFWLNVPEGSNITRGLTKTPQELRKCLRPEEQKPALVEQAKEVQRQLATSPDKKDSAIVACLLDPTIVKDIRRFDGTGRVEEWTLQLIEFYLKDWEKRGFVASTFVLVIKGLHLLLLGLAANVIATGIIFLFGFAFFAISRTKFQGTIGVVSRVLQTAGNMIAHLLLMWALYCVLVYINYNYAEGWFTRLAGLWGQPDLFLAAPIEFWVRAIYPVEIVIVGGILGAFILGLYLMLCYTLGKVNSDWLFSSRRIADYKCFLRMKFEPDRLTIYPIKLDRVPVRGGWRWRRNPGPAQSRVEPTSPLKPSLIEGPIVIEASKVGNVPRRGPPRTP